MNPQRVQCWVAMVAGLALGTVAVPGHAMVFLDNTSTAASYNATAPTGALAGSGWDLTGNLNSFIGTPIDSRYFVTAKHAGWNNTTQYSVTFASGPNQGTFNASKTEHWDDPNSDLRVWKLSSTANSFVSWAPLYTSTNEAGKDLVMFGRGYTRGAAVTVDSELKGWQWSSSGAGTKRWGTNVVTGYADYQTVGNNHLLYADFDQAAGGTEAVMANLDSGAGVFIKDGDTWKLAGVGYSVDGYFNTVPSDSGRFLAALFDVRGLYVGEGANWTYYDPAPVNPNPIPSAFYASRVSSEFNWIMGIVPEPGALLLLLLGGGCLGTRRR